VLSGAWRISDRRWGCGESGRHRRRVARGRRGPQRGPRPAGRLLSWLSAHRTRLGSLPEQVSAQGRPVSVAPLDWTDAVVLLALLAQDHHLPVPPVPAASQPPT
jgi:GH15 family glucan-1,4-alpha-glucosidase